MKLEHIVIGLSMAVLLAPSALAATSSTESQVDVLPSCSGAVDFACVHVDCTPVYCVRLICPVYVGHSGHVGLLSGCTPP